jgi:hypothetical protein
MDIARLMEEAGRAEEAFLPVLDRDGARAGVSARREGGSIVLEMEVQLRILPSRSAVDVPLLRRMVEAAAALREGGFHLHHYEDGWIVATLRIGEGDLAETVDLVRRALLAVG